MFFPYCYTVCFSYCYFCWGNDVGLQDWKAGRGAVGTLQPKFQPDADLSDISQPRMPSLKICTMTPDGHLTLPQDIRDRWLSDPVRRNFPNIGNISNSMLGFCWWKLFSIHGLKLVPSKTLIGEFDWKTLTAFLHPVRLVLLHQPWMQSRSIWGRTSNNQESLSRWLQMRFRLPVQQQCLQKSSRRNTQLQQRRLLWQLVGPLWLVLLWRHNALWWALPKSCSQGLLLMELGRCSTMQGEAGFLIVQRSGLFSKFFPPKHTLFFESSYFTFCSVLKVFYQYVGLAGFHGSLFVIDYLNTSICVFRHPQIPYVQNINHHV